MMKLTGLAAAVPDTFGDPITDRKMTGKLTPCCGYPIFTERAITIGQYIASAIGNEVGAEDPIANMKIALVVHGVDEAELEDAPYEIAKAALTKSGFPTLVKSACLLRFKAAEDAAAKMKKGKPTQGGMIGLTHPKKGAHHAE